MVNKKFTKKHVEVITPLRARCECGAKVTDHHYLCNRCWGDKAKEKRIKFVAKHKPRPPKDKLKRAESKKPW